MRTRTLLQLLTDVADRADIEVPGTDTFVTKTVMTRWLNQSVRRFVGLLIAAHEENYFNASTTFSTVAGTAEYDVPTDFFQLQYIRADISGVRVPIERTQKDALDRDIPGGSDGWDTCRPTFRILGNSFVFTPTPSAAHSVLVNYTPTFVVFDVDGDAASELEADDDYLDGINGWEEWVVLDVACKVLMKAERDHRALESERDDIATEIKEHASNRSADSGRVRTTWDEGNF